MVLQQLVWDWFRHLFVLLPPLLAAADPQGAPVAMLELVEVLSQHIRAVAHMVLDSEEEVSAVSAMSTFLVPPLVAVELVLAVRSIVASPFQLVVPASTTPLISPEEAVVQS